jgi:hypothetical protein
MKKLVVLCLSAFLFSGCATLFTGTKDTIHFDSTPSGAMVYKDGLEICKTPCSMPIKRSLNETDIEYRLDGYETRIFTLDQEFNVVSIINLGNLFGWAIDAATGAIMRYDRKSYDLELKPDTRALLMNTDKIFINTDEHTVDLYVSTR